MFVSIGHRVDLASAVKLVLACCTRYRIPEPTRQADLAVAEAETTIGVGETGATPVLLSDIGRRAENPQPSVINFAAKRFKHRTKLAKSAAAKGGGDFRQFRDGEKFLQIHRLAAFDAFGDVAENGASGHAAFAGDLLDGLAGAKTAQRFARGIAQAGARRRRGGRGEGIIRKNLAGVRRQMRGDFAEENLAELAQFLFADAADAGELAFVWRDNSAPSAATPRRKK